jgi:hypothetical protein
VSEDNERSCKGGQPQNTDRPQANTRLSVCHNEKKKHARQKTNLAAAIVLDDKVNVGHANLLDANVALVERPGVGEVRQGEARRGGTGATEEARCVSKRAAQKLGLRKYSENEKIRKD